MAMLLHVDDEAAERADSGSTGCVAAVARAWLAVASSGGTAGGGRVLCDTGAGVADATGMVAPSAAGPPAAPGAADWRSTRENALQLLAGGAGADDVDRAPPDGGGGGAPLPLAAKAGRAGELEAANAVGACG